ncbi:nucleotidyltransferase family protein [Fimbriimonas ginsengisoli]|uniref:D-glycero-D-manno-heptose 1-phosphate guanosyltransferase n=1 Tax=Fimbriimonas ginsengisoli Gsoil 348 TaxID=661478 RepID=A0A068NTH9_FIMGI|nr:nucleotidyltransferase family protein [Fimbriimonas ginsengisoli]AIE86647.1 D-glycero-D-manno-heptose 1-phosphate guanosyltransferase [Fimbriimonas ginsengisoli Gsoil 348]
MDLANFTTTPEDSIRNAMSLINRNAKGISIVVDDKRKVIDTITDGDIRRAILAGCSLESTVGDLLGTKQSHKPVTALASRDPEDLLETMKETSVRQLPLVDSEGRLVEVVTMEELVDRGPLGVQAVIMAGGFGTRLYPLTEQTPKSMLPVGDRPLMEHVIQSLRSAGIRQMSITTHYLAEKIIDHFGDGSQFGVNIRYCREETPLGTAGALSLLGRPADPTLVLNGDILTNVNYRSLAKFHKGHQADMTVCVRQYDHQVPYGVIQSEGEFIKGITEKPRYTFFVNAGIYLLEPHLYDRIPSGSRFDMPQLVESVIADGGRVVSFPIIEYWLDIGQTADYDRAQVDMKSGEFLS